MSASKDILLIDDSRADAHLAMKILFKRHLADRIKWISDGQEALDYLFHKGPYAGREGGNPRLILLDINMPGLNGLQILDRVRTDPVTKSVPVVLLSGSAMRVDVQLGYRYGANSYLVKPTCHKEFTHLLVSTGQYWMTANTAPA